MRRKAKSVYGNYPPAYVLQPGPFREEHVCIGKTAYYFFYDDGRFAAPDYKFFLQTQLLANALLSEMDGYVFWGQIFVDTVCRLTWEEVTALAHWKSEKDIKFLSCQNLGPQPSLQQFSFLARNLNAVSQSTVLVPEKDANAATDIFVDYYAISENDFRNERFCDSSQIKAVADLALISDDTHAVWTILRDKRYSHSMLLERLNEFCGFYSAELHWYEN